MSNRYKDIILCERVIGGKRGNKNLIESSLLDSMYLLTDMYSRLVFYYTITNEDSIIQGVEFNKKIIFGIKYNDNELDTKKCKKIIKIDGKNKYFDYIKIQNCIKPVTNSIPNRETEYRQYICYIQISYMNKEYTIGVEGSPGAPCTIQNNNLNGIIDERYYLETEKIEKPCVISGVGLCNTGFFCLQIIESLNGIIDESCIEQFTYGRSEIGFIESKIDTNTFKTDFSKKVFINTFDFSKTDFFHIDIDSNENDCDFNKKVRAEIQILNLETKLKLTLEKFIMDYQLIGIDDPEVLSLLTFIFSRIAYISPTEEGLNRYYPMFLSLIDRAIVNRDFTVIHAVKRIHRMLNYLIYKENEDEDIIRIKKTVGIYVPEKKTTLFNIEKPLLVKLNKIWKCFSETANKSQQIHQSQISLNAYQISLLSGQYYGFSIITFLCQICLIGLIGVNFKETNVNKIFPIIEGKIIIPVITIFSCIMAWKQMTNTRDFRNIFPDLKWKYLSGYLDIFSNYICAIAIVIFNFFLLAFNASLIDIVLNSIAALFIIELDDTAVFLTSDSLMDLLKQKLINEMFDRFKKIPSIYFNSNLNNTWKYNDSNILLELNRERYLLNEDNMEIEENENYSIYEDNESKSSKQIEEIFETSSFNNFFDTNKIKDILIFKEDISTKDAVIEEINTKLASRESFV
jgi:hypothetical protein